MNKKRLFDILYIVLIVSLIVFMIWIYFYLTSNATTCLNDPLAYYNLNAGESCSALCLNMGIP